MSPKRIMVAALLAASVIAAGALSAGCGGQKADLLQGAKTKKKGVLVVGTDATFPPFEDRSGGKFRGFDIDLASEIAARLGLDLEINDTKWVELFDHLESGDFDVVVSAVSITPERSERFSFSSPYMDVDQAVCVRTASPVRSTEDLAGKVVGVQADSTGLTTAEEIKGIKQIRRYDSMLVAFEDLEVKRIDAIVDDYPQCVYMQELKGRTRVAERIPTGEQYGVAAQLERTDMVAAVDRALQSIREDGTYSRIYEKWFGGERQ